MLPGQNLPITNNKYCLHPQSNFPHLRRKTYFKGHTIHQCKKYRSQHHARVRYRNPYRIHHKPIPLRRASNPGTHTRWKGKCCTKQVTQDDNGSKSDNLMCSLLGLHTPQQIHLVLPICQHITQGSHRSGKVWKILWNPNLSGNVWKCLELSVFCDDEDFFVRNCLEFENLPLKKIIMQFSVSKLTFWEYLRKPARKSILVGPL